MNSRIGLIALITILLGIVFTIGLVALHTWFLPLAELGAVTQAQTAGGLLCYAAILVGGIGFFSGIITLVLMLLALFKGY